MSADFTDTDFAVYYCGKWMTWEQFEKARLDVLMPPQPKQQWKRSAAPKSDGPSKQAEYRRQLLDARHQ